MTYDSKFYEIDLPKLEKFVSKIPEARSIIQKAFDKGYSVIIDTNPIFYREPILMHLKWGGIDDFSYYLINTLENSNYCKSKSNTEYYEQIIDKIGHSTEACLMAGHEEQDMIASQLRMQTFFIEDKKMKFFNHISEPTYRGSLLDLKNII